MIWILLGVLLLTLFYYYGIKSLTYWRDHGVKQQDLFPAFCTNWFTLIRKQTLADYLKCQYNRFPESRYQGIYLFNSRVLVVKDVDLIKQMVIKDFECFNEHRSFVNEDVDPMWGKNLFALKGSQWRNMRSTLSPSFTSSKMKGMFHLMTDTAERCVNFFLNQNKDLIEIEMKEVSSRYCNDVIASTAFGLEVDSLADPNNEFYKKGKEFTDLRSVKLMFRFFITLFLPSVSRMFNVKIIQSHIADFFTNIVEDTIKMREEKGLVRPDMIHLLLEARKGHTKHDEHQNVADTGYATVEEHLKGDVKTDITNEDIIAQALVFFFAGFDSSSTLISFMAYELCVNQDIQNRLREEITDTLANCNNKLTYEALVNMKYMDMVVSESLRKWPVQVAMDRVCTKPYTIEPTLPGEIPVHLSPGDLINLPIYGIHQDPELFPDPEVFDPERFSDDNKGNIKPYAFQPFGLGPRNCIGSRFALLETKILYFHLLANFKIVPIDTSVIPLQMVENMFSILPKHGFNMGLKRI